MVKGKSGIEKISSSWNRGEFSIKLDFKFPKLYRTYVRWNIKKVANYDKNHFESYGPVQIPPTEKGLYVLYDKKGTVLYVGINNDGGKGTLNSRLYKHTRSAKFKKYIYRIDTYLIEDKVIRDRYEFLLINTLFPIFNKDKTLYESREKEYLKNPFVYNENKLSDFEAVAKNFNVSPAYLLIQHYWDMKYEYNSAPNDVWNWIGKQSDDWINYIVRKNNTSEWNVLNEAYKYLNLVNYPGEEDEIPFDELKNNIFSDYLGWLRPDDEN